MEIIVKSGKYITVCDRAQTPTKSVENDKEDTASLPVNVARKEISSEQKVNVNVIDVPKQDSNAF